MRSLWEASPGLYVDDIIWDGWQENLDLLASVHTLMNLRLPKDTVVPYREDLPIKPETLSSLG